MQTVRLLYETEAERIFVETLAVLASVQVRDRGGASVVTTDEWIRDVAATRHPGVEWAPPTLERLKARYITRPGKPAGRVELLRQVVKGQRGKGGKPGTPSEYEPTGIHHVLEKYAGRPSNRLYAPLCRRPVF